MKQVEHISLQEATAKFEAPSVKMGPMSLLGPLKCTLKLELCRFCSRLYTWNILHYDFDDFN